MALALGLQLLATEGPFEGRQAAIWHWLIPLAYAGIILARTGVLPAAGATQARPLPNAEAGRLALRLCANGDLLDLDVTAREMLGIDPDLLTGTGFFERVHVADRVSLLCALADLRDYAGHRKVELRLRLPVPDRAAAGRPFAIDLSRDEEDDAVLVGFLRDNCEVAELRAALAASRNSMTALRLPRAASWRRLATNCARRSIRSSDFPTCFYARCMAAFPIRASASISKSFGTRAITFSTW